MIRINSDKLTTHECYSGANKAYWSLKYAYREVKKLQQELRDMREYALSDKLRDVLAIIEEGYSYKMGPITDD